VETFTFPTTWICGPTRLVPLDQNWDANLPLALWSAPACPLVKPTDTDDPQKDQINYRQYLPFEVIEKYLHTGEISRSDWKTEDESEIKPWTAETRSHNAIEPGTRQVKMPMVTLSKMQFDSNRDGVWRSHLTKNLKRATPTLRMGGEGHRALFATVRSAGEQWPLQDLSRRV